MILFIFSLIFTCHINVASMNLFLYFQAKNAGTLRKEQLSCSNLHHFQAFVNCILADKNCVSILHTFTVEDKIRRKISVDIVTDERHRWRKVIARNPRALSQISVGKYT